MVTLTAKRWNALLTTAAKKDVRYYLNGVYINAKDKRIEATDGHRLLYIEQEMNAWGTENIVLGVSLRDHKAKRGIEKVNVTYIDVLRSQVEFWSDTALVNTMIVRNIDGTFPDTNRVIPAIDKKIEVGTFGINPLLIADVSKVLLSGNYPKERFVKITHTSDVQIKVVFPNQEVLIVQLARI